MSSAIVKPDAFRAKMQNAIARREIGCNSSIIHKYLRVSKRFVVTRSDWIANTRKIWIAMRYDSSSSWRDITRAVIEIVGK